MVKYTDEQIIALITDKYAGQGINILAPVVKSRKGHYRELFDSIRKKGYLHVRVDGEIVEVAHDMKVDRYKVHDIEMVIDRIKVEAKSEKRLKDSIRLAMQQGQGTCMILGKDETVPRYFSQNLMCPTSGIAYEEPAPHFIFF